MKPHQPEEEDQWIRCLLGLLDEPQALELERDPKYRDWLRTQEPYADLFVETLDVLAEGTEQGHRQREDLPSEEELDVAVRGTVVAPCDEDGGSTSPTADEPSILGGTTAENSHIGRRFRRGGSGLQATEEAFLEAPTFTLKEESPREPPVEELGAQSTNSPPGEPVESPPHHLAPVVDLLSRRDSDAAQYSGTTSTRKPHAPEDPLAVPMRQPRYRTANGLMASLIAAAILLVITTTWWLFREDDRTPAPQQVSSEPTPEDIQPGALDDWDARLDCLRNSPFVDVQPDAGHWWYEAVQRLRCVGVLPDDSDSFRPEEPITLQEFLAWLLPLAFSSHKYGAEGHQQFVKEGVSRKLISVEQATWPEAPLSRGEAIAMLIRTGQQSTLPSLRRLAAKYEHLRFTSVAVPFEDLTDPNHWAYPYIYAARDTCVVNGYSDGSHRVGVDDQMNRAEAAKVVCTATGICEGFCATMVPPGWLGKIMLR
ncbi:MAG: hypothetical protein COW42_13730 [Deltaproteobacteria bacterium CG17_big_fil_post_rev_8_21_14_2_50_63_7]|nr:MAG: hypothetical protein COW42_13730 [Deltaproteobacteria bacterium CG17_big_fil_post_rev_8_21_14_2_50_63_7]